MNSQLYRVGRSDIVRGLITAVGASVFMALGGIFSQAGFDLFSADWQAIANDVFKVATATFMGYLSKNFFTSSDGKIGGIKI